MYQCPLIVKKKSYVLSSLCLCLVQVTEPAKALLEAGEEIPCDLMAKILKFQLLQIKANDQQRREAEQVSVSLYMQFCVLVIII